MLVVVIRILIYKQTSKLNIILTKSYNHFKYSDINHDNLKLISILSFFLKTEIMSVILK